MLFLITVVVVLAILIAGSYVGIPPYHYGVWSVLGYRVRGERGILREGPHLVPPFISSVELVSMELVPKAVGFSFTTRDKLHLTISGVFQYRPDPSVSYKKPNPDFGRNVYVTVSEDSIFKGVIETLEAKLGGLGGKYDHSVFITHRQALGNIINAILRMENAPHLIHDHNACGVEGCKYETQVPAENLVEFYDSHWVWIKTVMRKEKNLPDNRSEIERRYGIDVESFDLGNVDFTKEMMEALEEERQAESRARAADTRLETALKFRDKLGASPQTAADEADLLMDPAEVKKTIISVQGEAGVLGGLIGGLVKRGAE